MHDTARAGYDEPVDTVSAMREGNHMWETILWIAAVVIGVFGVIRIVQRDFLWGAVLIVVALLVGPGGVSIFS